MTFRYYVNQLAKMEPAKRQQLERCATARTEKWIDVPGELAEPVRASPQLASRPLLGSHASMARAGLPTMPSEGVGDTLKKVADATGLSHLARLYERATGRPCGCAQRQTKLNEMFPYDRRSTPRA
jgi:hypothetical protein